MPLDSCVVFAELQPMTHRAAFSARHYAGIRTPLSSRHISEEPAVCSHEGAIRPLPAMRRQHVFTYFQQSERVCLQPNREQISEEPLNGTYKLIAKWLKSLNCYLSESLRGALCRSSMKPVPLLPTNHLVPEAIHIFIATSQRKAKFYIEPITCHYSDAYATLVR